MKTTILSALAFCAAATAADESPYLKPPAYDRALRLADGLAVAELVVDGTARDGKMRIHKVLFGKAPAGVKLARISRTRPNARGVWLLVKTRGGYLSVNPEIAPIPLEEYRGLKRPAEHWMEVEGLVSVESDRHQLYYTYPNPKGEGAIWHGANTYGLGRGITLELKWHGHRQVRISWDDRGRMDRVLRSPKQGHGFFLDYEGDRLIWFRHFKDGKPHGLERRYYSGREEPPRLEKHYVNGVPNGRKREWDADGTLVTDIKFERGLIPPIVRYAGKGTSGVQMRRHEDGVYYAGAPSVGRVKVGMTTKEVSELLKVDFSPASGIHFPTYHLDLYLHIAFEDGKVSALKTGHNGVCLDFVSD